MASITPCVPDKMRLKVRELAREGWRIISVRGDTGYVLASYWGSAAAFKWDGERLKRLPFGMRTGGDS